MVKSSSKGATVGNIGTTLSEKHTERVEKYLAPRAYIHSWKEKAKEKRNLLSQLDKRTELDRFLQTERDIRELEEGIFRAENENELNEYLLDAAPFIRKYQEEMNKKEQYMYQRQATEKKEGEEKMAQDMRIIHAQIQCKKEKQENMLSFLAEPLGEDDQCSKLCAVDGKQEEGEGKQQFKVQGKTPTKGKGIQEFCSSNAAFDDGKILQEYLEKFDEMAPLSRQDASSGHENTNRKLSNDENSCRRCGASLYLSKREAEVICTNESCGVSFPFMDYQGFGVESISNKITKCNDADRGSETETQRLNRMEELLKCLQAEEEKIVPEEVIQEFLSKTRQINFTAKAFMGDSVIKKAKKILKLIHRTKYNDNIPQILKRALSVQPVKLSPNTKTNIRVCFMDVSRAYDTLTPSVSSRKHFIPYMFALNRIAHHCAYDFLMRFLPVSNSVKKHYPKWKEICDLLQWQFHKC